VKFSQKLPRVELGSVRREEGARSSVRRWARNESPGSSSSHLPLVEVIVRDVEGEFDIEVVVVDGAGSTWKGEDGSVRIRETKNRSVRTEQHGTDRAIEGEEGAKGPLSKLVLQRRVRPPLALLAMHTGVDGSSDCGEEVEKRMEKDEGVAKSVKGETVSGRKEKRWWRRRLTSTTNLNPRCRRPCGP
jgi:hypothetical protein